MERWAPFLPEGFIGLSTGVSNASNFDDINQANKQLAGGFRYVLFSPLPGEMIQFD